MKLRWRKLNPAVRPIFSKQDAWFLLEFPVLFATATFARESGWAHICIRLERLKAKLGAFSPTPILHGMRLMNGAGFDPMDAFRVAATRSEHHLQIIREFFWGWTAPLTLLGRNHIDEALAKRRGAVLWVAHFSFNALASKKALHEAGFAVSHVSRPEHGFSKSRFGIALLNPIRVAAERRYLRSRIIFDRGRSLAAMRTAHRLLAANRVVSITAGAWEGSQIATVVINGCELDLATGAPGLAHLTGAPLLPVMTVRDDASGEIRVIVENAIPVNGGANRGLAVLEATQAFVDRLAPYVDRYRLQWRDWEKVRSSSP